MSGANENAALVGAGAAACAVCCAGPILGFVAALGLGAAAGAMLFGVVGLLVVAAVGVVVIGRRRRRQATCTAAREAQPVALGSTRGPAV